MEYLRAFIIGGGFCLIGQLLIDFTKLTPARILVAFVVSGVFLGLLGVYEPLIEYAGAGASVPLTGFGYNLFDGVRKAISEDGFLGVFTGGFTSAAAGMCAAIIFGAMASVLHYIIAMKNKGNR